MMPSRPLLAGSPRAHRRCAGTPSAHQRRSWVLPTGPAGARHARRIAREQLRKDRLEHHADTIELLVSELVTNAVIHGGGQATLSIRTLQDTLRCAVTDDRVALPRPRPPSPDSETGRGLHLLDALAPRWGVLPQRRGKTVWFELTARPEV